LYLFNVCYLIWCFDALWNDFYNQMKQNIEPRNKPTQIKIYNNKEIKMWKNCVSVIFV
jgi:hypothetical protein